MLILVGILQVLRFEFLQFRVFVLSPINIHVNDRRRSSCYVFTHMNTFK